MLIGNSILQIHKKKKTLAVVGRNMEGRRIRKKEKPFKSERYDKYTHNIT
jgi:hypothetical protein